MFALLALVCFILEIAKIDIGAIDSFMLGMVFLALHLLIGTSLFYGVKIGRKE